MVAVPYILLSYGLYNNTQTHKHIYISVLVLCALYALLSSLFLIATKLWYLFPEFCQLSASFSYCSFLFSSCCFVLCFVCVHVLRVERLSFDECGKINRRLHGTTAELKSLHKKHKHFYTTMTISATILSRKFKQVSMSFKQCKSKKHQIKLKQQCHRLTSLVFLDKEEITREREREGEKSSTHYERNMHSVRPHHVKLIQMRLSE